MGDTILGVGSDGRVHVPERKGDCLSTDPIGVDGFLLSAVASKMCCKPNSVDAAERRTRRAQRWGERSDDLFSAQLTHAASCLDTPSGSMTAVDDGETTGESHDVRVPGASEPPPRPNP